MKYKEFQTGLIPITTTFQMMFEETSNEYSFFAADIFNRAANALDLRSLGGWDSVAAKLAGIVYGITAFPADFSGNITAQQQANVATRLIQIDNINASGQIAGNGQGGVYASVADCQLIFMQAGRPSGVGDVEVFGVFKSEIEGISQTFQTGTITSGNPSDWIDCRAYSTMSFEVRNTGATTLTGFQGQRRRHLLTTMPTLLSFAFTDSFSANPMATIQQVRNASTSAASATGTTTIDINVGDLHGIRFSVTGGQCVVRGVLKG